jgi:hypothetical protein
LKDIVLVRVFPLERARRTAEVSDCLLTFSPSRHRTIPAEGVLTNREWDHRAFEISESETIGKCQYLDWRRIKTIEITLYSGEERAAL